MENGSKVILDGRSFDDRITPDGRQIAFVEPVPGAAPAVRVQSIGGDGSSRVVTRDRVRPGRVRVSPDGRWVAYPAFDERNPSAVAVCDLAARPGS